MTVPTKLAEWSLAVVQELLGRGVFESEEFDFKQALPHKSDAKAKARLTKSIAAFANSGGGFIVFGVRDERGLSIDDRLVGVDSGFDFPAVFGNYPAQCEPSVEWDIKNPPIGLPQAGRVLHVVQVRSTWSRPHSVPEDGRFQFPKRTNKGNEDMSYSEVKGAFQEAEYRRTKLALLISELTYIQTVASRLLSQTPDPPPKLEGQTLHWAWATRYGTTLLDMILGDAYSFVAEDPDVWPLLNKIRDAARHSNAVCAAFGSIVFLAMDDREAINRQHYKTVRDAALEIADGVTVALPRIQRLLAK